MFTGLIEEVGQVLRVQREGRFQRLEVGCRQVLEGLQRGDSVDVDGACQTVVDLGTSFFAVESVAETLERTTLGEFRPGRPVNLERALRLQDRLGGHLVLGHVDGVGRVSRLEERQREWLLGVVPPPSLARYLAAKGSIAVDGISLTVADAGAEGFTVAVIPHTFEHTNLAQRCAGERVNLEVDVIARYVERLLRAGSGDGGAEGLTLEKLGALGF